MDFTGEDFLFDEVDANIQQNLEDEIVKEALKSGVDLRQYAKQVEKELLEVESASIQDYIKECQNIASLHHQISNCDNILERMEGLLQGFQLELCSISAEIQHLQEQSLEINHRLSNRQAVRGELSQFVDEMVVPEAMITNILDTPVTERAFVEQLQDLNHKIAFVKMQSFRDARACIDVQEILEKLKTKAIIKIREFLLQKIIDFRKAMSNYQVPQNTLLKHRFFSEFLMANERNVAKEVKDLYIDTMSKVYYSYFKTYNSRLLKLQQEDVPDKDDLMGIEDTARRGIFSSRSSMKHRATVFSLGQRGVVLTDVQSPVIVPHASDVKVSYEQLFRSLHWALTDNCCREYLFLTDFFMLSGSAAVELFNTVMHRSLHLFLKQIEASVETCYDAIGLLLCMHIVFRLQAVCREREVPALDSYWKAVLKCLLPRFMDVVAMNIHSVRDCDPARLSQVDTRPHYIIRRYAEFSAGIGAVDAAQPQEKVHELLASLQTEVENFILRVAAEFPSRRQQLICLINNYDMMLGVIVERAGEESAGGQRCRELLAARTAEYVEEMLSPHFGGLVMFVREAESALELNKTGLFSSLTGKVVPLVKGFNADWKRAIESINVEVMQSFTNFRNGTQINQATLTQLVQYYHRFQKILSQAPFKSLPVRQEMMNIHHLMVEVKKYKANF